MKKTMWGEPLRQLLIMPYFGQNSLKITLAGDEIEFLHVPDRFTVKKICFYPV